MEEIGRGRWASGDFLACELGGVRSTTSHSTLLGAKLCIHATLALLDRIKETAALTHAVLRKSRDAHESAIQSLIEIDRVERQRTMMHTKLPLRLLSEELAGLENRMEELQGEAMRIQAQIDCLNARLIRLDVDRI